MIVDDEPNVVNGLVEHISWTELGLSVEMTANDGEEALNKIRERQPDIVITDVYMPKMDGLTLIRHLREEFPHIYIVIHSGYDEFENARIAMRYGVQHFLLKPSIVSEISAVMSEIVQEMNVDEKRHSLIQRFEEQQQSYMKFVKDTFIRELLVTRYQAEDIPAEKLELLQLSGDTRVIAAKSRFASPTLLDEGEGTGMAADEVWLRQHYSRNYRRARLRARIGHSCRRLFRLDVRHCIYCEAAGARSCCYKQASNRTNDRQYFALFEAFSVSRHR